MSMSAWLKCEVCVLQLADKTLKMLLAFMHTKEGQALLKQLQSVAAAPAAAAAQKVC